jgi:ketosteroid isomerase-like protein
MNLTYVRAFTHAMEQKDMDDMFIHMTEDVVLRTPLVAEPFEGKAVIRPVAEALMSVVDKFDLLELMEGPQHVAKFFRVTIGPYQLDGVDYWLFN